MALTNRTGGATTTNAADSRVMAEFFKGDPEDFGPGVVGGDAAQIRDKMTAASRRVHSGPSHQGGQHVTTSDSLKAGPRMTCSKCGASASVLVNDPGSPGHEICVSCAHCEELAYPAPGEVIPQTKEAKYPSRAMVEP